MHKIIIIIGPPGSGKGTQAKKIASKYDYGHISTGDLLRGLAGKEQLSAQEEEAVLKMKAGEMVPDELIYILAFEAIERNLSAGRGVVLDGAIRNVGQAKEFDKFFESKNLLSEVMALEIFLSDEDAFSRLTKRRVCGKCGEIVPWLPETKDITSCPKCGSELTVRQDDSPEVIQKRIEDQGEKALEPILDYYKKAEVLKTINGNQSIENVEKDIEKILTE